ncbi:helix-turn-helix domain-containing protein [Pseudonocardia alni]|uniref:ImmA/IrrE family metallo-endopeptidase n=1 Tax=Pseudonocardia alni TaxID=33907 RepID=UPI00340EC636
MTVSPSRLLLARKLRGLTLADVSRIAELNPQTLSRYENGRQEPSSESLARLSDALSVKEEFFSLPEVDGIPLEAVSFRALSKTPAFRRDQALAGGEIAVEIAEWISSRYRTPSPDLLSVALPENSSLTPVEEAALRLRNYWELGSKPVANVLHLLESRGIRIFSLVQEVRDVDAFSFFRRGVPYILVDTGKTAERQRFDLAHELGHLVLHQGSERVHGRDAERQADRFAAAFLMPREDVLGQHMRNASVERILAGRRRWKVSAMALTHRLREIGLLTEWGYRSCCVELSKAGYRSSEPGSNLVAEASQVLDKVLSHLRSPGGGGVRRLIDDLCLSPAEFSRHIFGLVPTVIVGESMTGNAVGSRKNHSGRSLTLVTSDEVERSRVGGVTTSVCEKR